MVDGVPGGSARQTGTHFGSDLSCQIANFILIPDGRRDGRVVDQDELEIGHSR